jgi:NADH-quinone oxidoreductase subunit N
VNYGTTDTFVLTPEILLVLFACALLFTSRRWTLPMLFTGLAFTATALLRQSLWLDSNHAAELAAFGGSLTADRFALFFDTLFLATAALVAGISKPAIERDFPEFAAMLLFAQCGMFLLAGGLDLITLFLGLEVMALSFYILTGFTREDRRSNEAALKFLILGAFSSGLVAYGFSLLYALSGSTRLNDIANAVASRDSRDPLLLLALATAGAGVLFKVGAVPFHMWVPDAYEGAPTPASAYLAIASTAASVALLVRLFAGPFAANRTMWEPLLALVAVATLTLGNLAAIAQTNVKRLLAYSSISHAGYLLLGIVAGNKTAFQGIAVYLLTYVFMTVGAFAVVIAIHRSGAHGEDISELNGLARRNPWIAILMLLFLLSLAGIPPTAGFLGKYYLLQSLVETGHYKLAAIGTLYVVVAVYYYFRLVRSMFLTEPADPRPIRTGAGMRVVLALSGLLTLAIGILPEPFLRFAALSVAR